MNYNLNIYMDTTNKEIFIKSIDAKFLELIKNTHDEEYFHIDIPTLIDIINHNISISFVQIENSKKLVR